MNLADASTAVVATLVVLLLLAIAMFAIEKVWPMVKDVYDNAAGLIRHLFGGWK